MLSYNLVESYWVFVNTRVLVLGNTSEIELASPSSPRLSIVVRFSLNEKLKESVQDLDSCSPAVKVIISFTSDEADFNQLLHFVWCAEIVKEFLMF